MAVATRDHERATRTVVLAVLTVLVATGAALRWSDLVRRSEASCASWVIGRLGIARTTSLGGDRFVLHAHRTEIVEVAAACSSLFLGLPLLVVGLQLWLRRSARRPIVTMATLVALAALFALNQARFVVIALSVRVLGEHSGFPVGHLLLGSGLSLVGVALTAVGLVAVVQRTSHEHRATARNNTINNNTINNNTINSNTTNNNTSTTPAEPLP